MTDTDCAQVRDFGRANPWPAVQAEYERMRDEIQRLTDEVAFLARSRDEWRDLQQRAMANAKEATMELQRVREERESWRERALQAEAQLAAGGAK